MSQAPLFSRINITSDEINALPLHAFDGSVNVIQDKDDLPYVFEDLELVFCKKYERKVAQGNTFSWDGKLWIINGNKRYDYRILNVNAHLDGSTSFDIMGKVVTASIFEKAKKLGAKAG